MRKLLTVSLAVLALAMLLVTPAFAHDSVVGCVVDANGDPWTHGGTVTAILPFTSPPLPEPVVVGQGEIGPDGCYEVYIGNGPRVEVIIDPGPGPAGDPEPQICYVPSDSNNPLEAFPCPTIDTGTGPNAISLRSVDASISTLPLLMATASLVALAGAGLFVWRRSQMAA